MNNGVRYNYFRKDHLGNNREVWNGVRKNYSGTVKELASTRQRTQYYPSGLPCASITTDYPALQVRKYNGKEFVEMNGYDTYDYGARGYYPPLGRFMSVDPMAEKYYSISPYAYCGGNPVNRIDPDGREWKDGQDKKIAAQIQKEVASRDKSLAKQEGSINAKIDNIKNNTKLSDDKRSQQIATQQNKLEGIKTERNLMSALDKGITQLGDSKTKYTFNTVESGTTATLSSEKDGTVIINNYGTLGNRSHETTHAIDYDNKLMSFNPLGSNNLRISDRLSSEIRAYGTEYSITEGIVPQSDNGNPNSIFGITPDWLYGLRDASGTYIYRPSNYK